MSWTQLLTDHLLTTTLAFLTVWCATCFVKRPLVRHLLWGAVLLKFLLPPLVSFTIPWPDGATETPVASVPIETVSEPQRNDARLLPQDNPAAAVPTADRIEFETRVVPTQLVADSPARGTPAMSWPSPEQLFQGLMLAWGIGTILVLLIAIRRAWRFQRLLNRTATHDRVLQAEVDELARDSGLKRPPSVLLTSAAVSPMLWAIVRPALIFPSELLTTLPAAERRALLLHELAHLARRDHWIRKLELLITLLWWWHPGVWLARRELHSAEEECCDAWVVAQNAEGRRQYADALLATLDFLADPHPLLPPVACGVGRISRLERRLIMILHRPISSLGIVARSFLALGILGILGASLTFAQDKGETMDKKGKATSGSDETARPFAGKWKPPENPDPNNILHEAVEDRREGQYEQALAKHLWYHRHALEYQESQSGVRRSFALNYWLELGEKYPPALAKFKEIRDETKQRIYREQGAHATFEDFHDLTAMNRTLDEQEQTVEAFQFLHKHNFDAAERVYHVAEPALIHAKEYQLCGKYLTPNAPHDEWPRIVQHFEYDRELAENPKFGKRHLDFARKNFVNETTTLVALLAVNDREEQAEKIAEAARKQPIDEAFREQFNKALEEALQGTVPKPWP